MNYLFALSGGMFNIFIAYILIKKINGINKDNKNIMSISHNAFCFSLLVVWLIGCLCFYYVL